MKVVRTVAEMRASRMSDRGFVPTMGALHEGHLALIREARRAHREVCVSIFVNPLQFGANEDFARYPRDEHRDLELAQSAGADLVLAPSTEELLADSGTVVSVSGLGERWEGACRPGHFDGVATIVSKLFHIVEPQVAYFGWKDLQQCLVVAKMVRDLNFPVQLSFVETLRERDGLAMSSRNAYLDASQRAKAPLLHEVLVRIARDSHAAAAEELERLIAEGARQITKAGFQLDYLDVVDMSDMEPLRTAGRAAAIVAAKIGTTRLIDNVRFDLRGSGGLAK